MTSSIQRSDLRLAGKRILLADDEFLIALDLQTSLSDMGADIIGPFATLKETLSAAEREVISVALLDIRLGEETTEPVAALLAERGIPFVFFSGQVVLDHIRRQWPECGIVTKPASVKTVVDALVAVMR